MAYFAQSLKSSRFFDLIYSMDSAGDLSASLDIQSPDRKDGQVWSISAQMRWQQASDYNLDFLQFFFFLTRVAVRVLAS